MKNISENTIDSIVGAILEDYNGGRTIDKMDVFSQPDKEIIINLLEKLRRVILPGYFKNKSYRVYTAKNNVSMLVEDILFNLKKQVMLVLKYKPDFTEASYEELEKEAERVCEIFLKKIPEIRAYVETDIQAAYDGDPAATCKEEIVFSYPGFYAIIVNRLAHELYKLEVPLIPRIMTEHAHSVTGIDIHPGATIGKYFFIDHGTGIVIGETTVIGDNVKIYQGVTLGALSTRGGQKLRDVKRHPTIEDNVTIYSGSSILGGETVIGKNVVIGSNTFITKSISEGTKVSIKNQELKFTYGKGAHKETTEPEVEELWYYMI